MTTRLKPSQNQIQYLLRVGVPAAELGDLGREVGFVPPARTPTPAPAPAPVPTPLTPAGPARKGFLAWLDRMFRFLCCTLLLAVTPAYGVVAGGPEAAPAQVAEPDRLTSLASFENIPDQGGQIPLLWNALATLEREVQTANEAIRRLSTRLAMDIDRTERVTDQMRNELAEHGDHLSATSARLVQQSSSLAAFSQAVQSQLHEVRVNLGVEEAHSSELEEQLDEALAQLDDNTAEVIKKTGVQDEKIRELGHLLLLNGQSNDASAATLELVVDSLGHVTTVLMGLFIVGCGLVLVRCGPMIQAPWRFDFTRNAGLRPSPALDGSAKSRGNSVIVRQLPAAEPEKAVPVIAEAAKTTRLLKPRRDRRSAKRFFRVLAKRVGRLTELKSLPPLQRGAPNLGFATCRGNVRERNEDFGCAFSVGSGIRELHHVLIVADGVGGRPFGADASYLAVRAAAASLIAELGTSESTDGDARQKAAENAMQAAAQAIAQGKKPRKITNPEDGLQTTLIIAVCPPDAGPIGYSDIGDGMGICAGQGIDAEPRAFMIPQKADLLQTNLLAACLGPQVLGAPCSGQFERKEGELVILATDGVADRVSTRFAAEFTAHLEWARGNVTTACESALQQMADYREKGVFVCDDNMTLAVSGAAAICEPDKAGSNGKAHPEVLAPVVA